MKRSVSLITAASLAAAAIAFALTGASAGASSTSAPSTLPTISVAMDRTSIKVGGTLQSGAVNVVSKVTQEQQGAPTLVRLNPGATFAQAFAAAAAHHGDPNYIDPYGAIVFAADVNRGVASVQTTLQPGTYVALDTAGNDPRRWPHTQFTIAQAASPASLPTPQATIRAIEFGFRGPSTLHNGELVRAENDGFLVHMFIALGVKGAKDASKVTTLLLAGKDRQAQRLSPGFFSFAGPLSPGGVQQFAIHARPGIYVLVCFMNTQDGREHTQLGMQRTIRILK